MLTWLKIAFRNIIKNSRRSVYTIIAIALGFAAINVFAGFTSYIFTTIQTNIIHIYGLGHLSLFKEGYRQEGLMDPASYLINKTELKELIEILDSYPEVILVSPQLQVSGMVSNGKASTSFLAWGAVPSHVQFFQDRAGGALAAIDFYNGRSLEDDISYGVGLSSGLSSIMDLQAGDRGMVITSTVDGMINALDIEVFQTFEAPLEGLNNSLMRVPLSFAQSLYDTDSVARVSVLLDNDSHTEAVKSRLADVLPQAGLTMEAATWQELGANYRKVKEMFEVIFIFLFAIILIIIVMSIVNTISISIMERTREIGTLRVLGMKKSGIIRLFALESALLGIGGCLLGIFLTVISWWAVILLDITWIPPQFSIPIPLEIHLLLSNLAFIFIFLVLLSTISAILPARKAARKNIVDALGHV